MQVQYKASMGIPIKSGLAAAVCAVSVSAWSHADTTCAPEAACVLDAVWAAALVLPEEKKDRIASLMVETAGLASADLAQNWADRLGTAAVEPTRRSAEPDFGWRHARNVLQQEGLEGLLTAARAKRAPLNFGRAEILLAAGQHFVSTEPAKARRVNEALASLARSASGFEQPSLAHAALELAMYRCDQAMFQQVLSLTDNPDSLRYAFWSARLSGGVGRLLDRVRSEADDEDTRHVRQALDGYRAILEHGYCPQADPDVVD
ncbi:MAG: hypothetical protein QNI84_04105 [Henriciella sp.]|nr:hypothetical protein [Henriciella sp.]